MGFYRFNVASMLALIDEIDQRGLIRQSELIALDGLNDAAIEEYKRFLEAAKLISVSDSFWRAEDTIHRLGAAIRQYDFASSIGIFMAVSSFALFLDMLAREGRLTADEAAVAISRRSFATYQLLAELCCVGAPIAGEGFYATPLSPPPAEFAMTAVRRYDDLARGEPLVSVGAWLESLIREDRIHPLSARARLEEAVALGLLRRITEGSTPDTRHDRHSLRVLHIVGGRPEIGTIYLYRGDFLIPGKSSVSLRLERGSL
jgi:hypothetical protein